MPYIKELKQVFPLLLVGSILYVSCANITAIGVKCGGTCKETNMCYRVLGLVPTAISVILLANGCIVMDPEATKKAKETLTITSEYDVVLAFLPANAVDGGKGSARTVEHIVSLVQTLELNKYTIPKNWWDAWDKTLGSLKLVTEGIGFPEKYLREAGNFFSVFVNSYRESAYCGKDVAALEQELWGLYQDLDPTVLLVSSGQRPEVDSFWTELRAAEEFCRQESIQWSTWVGSNPQKFSKARRRLLEEHILKWLPAFCDKVIISRNWDDPNMGSTWAGYFQLIKETLKHDCAFLGIDYESAIREGAKECPTGNGKVSQSEDFSCPGGYFDYQEYILPPVRNSTIMEIGDSCGFTSLGGELLRFEIGVVNELRCINICISGLPQSAVVSIFDPLGIARGVCRSEDGHLAGLLEVADMAAGTLSGIWCVEVVLPEGQVVTEGTCASGEYYACFTEPLHPRPGDTFTLYVVGSNPLSEPSQCLSVLAFLDWPEGTAGSTSGHVDILPRRTAALKFSGNVSDRGLYFGTVKGTIEIGGAVAEISDIYAIRAVGNLSVNVETDRTTYLPGNDVLVSLVVSDEDGSRIDVDAVSFTIEDGSGTIRLTGGCQRENGVGSYSVRFPASTLGTTGGFTLKATATRKGYVNGENACTFRIDQDPFREIRVDSVVIKSMSGTVQTVWKSEEEGKLEVTVKNLTGQDVKGASVAYVVKSKKTGVTLSGYPKSCPASAAVAGLYVDRLFIAPSNPGFTPDDYTVEVTANYPGAEPYIGQVEFAVNPRLPGHDVHLLSVAWENPAVTVGDMQVDVGEYLRARHWIKNEGIYSENSVTVWIAIVGSDRRSERTFTVDLLSGKDVLTPTVQLPTDGLAAGFYDVECGCTATGDIDKSNDTMTWRMVIGNPPMESDQIPLQSFRLFRYYYDRGADTSTPWVKTGEYDIRVHYENSTSATCFVKNVSNNSVESKSIGVKNIRKFFDGDVVVYLESLDIIQPSGLYSIDFKYGIRDFSFVPAKPSQVVFPYMGVDKRHVKDIQRQNRGSYDFYLPVGDVTERSCLVAYMPPKDKSWLNANIRYWSPDDITSKVVYDDYGGSLYFFNRFMVFNPINEYYNIIPGKNIPEDIYNFLIFQHKDYAPVSGEYGWLHSVRLIVQAYHDLTITSVNAPSDITIGDVPVISVQVFNNGSAVESNFLVTLDINDSYAKSVASFRQTVQSLPAQSSADVIFDSWDTSSLQPDLDYVITARVSLSTDMQPSNDSSQLSRNLLPLQQMRVVATTDRINVTQHEIVNITADVTDPGGAIVGEASVVCVLTDVNHQERQIPLHEKQTGEYLGSLIVPDKTGEFTLVVKASKSKFADGTSGPLTLQCTDASPDTFLVPPTPRDATIIDSRRVEFAWSGVDITTPTKDLSYAFRLDGQFWNNFESTTGVVLDLTGGNHNFQVKAKDSNSNEDPTPANISFFVNSFAVSGEVKDALGRPVSLAVVSTAGRSTVSDPNGCYTLTGFGAGKYVVTVQAWGFMFDDLELEIGDTDLENMDLVGHFVGYTISGMVSSPSGIGVPEVIVDVMDEFDTSCATRLTDSNGYYSIHGLSAGRYRIVPVSTQRNFTPHSQSVSVPPNRVKVDFCTSSTTLFVDNDAPNDPGTGTSDNPFRHIQDAINAAFDGDRIIVGDGTYQECISVNGKTIEICGKNQDSWNSVESTVITPSEEFCAVVTIVDSNTILRGLTVRGGQNYGYSGGRGGGIACYSESNKEFKVTVQSCIIRENKIVLDMDNGFGAGIYGDSFAVLILDHNVIQENTILIGSGDLKGFGGGIYSSNAKTEIRANRIVNNGIKDWQDNPTGVGGGEHCGGGVYLVGGVVCNNEIKANYISFGQPSCTQHYGSGGGVYCISGGKILSNVITNNTVSVIQGYTTESSCIVMPSYAFGGGVYARNTEIGNNLIARNICQSKGASNGCYMYWQRGGDGFSRGGGIYSSQCMTSNDTICDNQVIAQGGAGEYLCVEWHDDIPYETACPDNGDGIVEGGGIYSEMNTSILNSIVWGNTSNPIHGDASIAYSTVQGGMQGPNNIKADPLFADPGSGDYHLKSQYGRFDPSIQAWLYDEMTSPCIDAGDPQSDWSKEPWPNGKRINMGTFGGTPEASISPIGCVADINKDWTVDDYDLQMFVADWMKSSPKEIPQGSVKVDGDLNEWSDNVYWYPLHEVYNGNPSDISRARFALRWNEATNKIYAAVVIKDSSHIFSDSYSTWDKSDRIEVYCQATAANGPYNRQTCENAQKYFVAPTSSGDSWASFSGNLSSVSNTGFEYSVKVKGDYFVYEVGVTPFEYYGGPVDKKDRIPDRIVDLKTGNIIGFDITAITCIANSGYAGMLSENLMTGKSEDAGKFAKYTLIKDISSQEMMTAQDLNRDFLVNIEDFAILAMEWLSI